MSVIVFFIYLYIYQYVGNYILIINAISFITYGIDKLLAKHNQSRISEKTLLLFGFFLGFLGCVLGMKVFKHKTIKNSFKTSVYLIFLIHIVIFMYLMFKNII